MSGRRKVYVVGVGMTEFVKPGSTDDDYPELARKAVTRALEDARLDYSAVQQAAVGYVYGDSTCGQRALYEVGMSGIPIYNVNNNCSTGGTALLLAKQLVEGGTCDCALALGFEKMARGSLTSKFDDRTNPMDKHVLLLANTHGIAAAPVAAQLFGSAGREHMQRYGTRAEHFARIAEKNHRHSQGNPYSQFREPYSLQQILASPAVYDPLTRLQCCPTSDGAAAAILASEGFVREHGLEAQAVEILGMEMATDLPTTFSDNSCIKMVGFDMTRRAADALFGKAGVKRTDVNVIELHDCFSTNELLSYEALGLCPEGEGAQMVERGDNTYGGRYVVNPSGGLISKGHPLGATGIAQCAELCWQLRGAAGPRQVPGAKLALQHNIGLGGAVIVALYRMAALGQEHPVLEPPAEVLSLKSGEFFTRALGLMQAAEGALDKRVRGSLRLNVLDEATGRTVSGAVTMDGGRIAITFDPAHPADCTISVSDSVLHDILRKRLTFEKAFFAGKLKLSGNVAFLTRLMSMKNLLLSKL